MTAYAHRNGEKERPTIDGAFFFVGELGDAYGWSEDDDTEVMVRVDEDEAWRPGDNEYPALLSKCDGYWWGPVPTPEYK